MHTGVRLHEQVLIRCGISLVSRSLTTVIIKINIYQTSRANMLALLVNGCAVYEQSLLSVVFRACKQSKVVCVIPSNCHKLASLQTETSLRHTSVHLLKQLLKLRRLIKVQLFI